MKTCAQYQSQLLDHLYGLLEPEEGRDLAVHVGQCAPCRAALAQTEGRRHLLARAAKSEFAGLQFGVPSARKATLPLARSVPSRRGIRWAAAAAILLVVGGTLSILYLLDYRTQQQTVKSLKELQDSRVAELTKRTTQFEADRKRADLALRAAPVKHQQLQAEEAKDLAAVDKELLAKQLNMVITGPPTLQPGAPNEYRIEVKNLNNAPVAAQLDVQVRDQSDKNKVVYEQKDIKAQGTYVLALPADLPLKADANLYLEVAARAEGEGKDKDQPLRQKLSLARPVYVTHLTTDKPMYQPGESVYFRSLTLDRFTLRPAEESLQLVYTLTNPNGKEDVLLGGPDRLLSKQDNQTHLLRGPDKQPLRGIGAGSYAIDPQAVGGEYTLTVKEASNRFQAERRKFIVNRYQPPRLNKKLDFTRKSYGAGEQVEAFCHVSRVEGGQPVADRPVEATVRIDGKEYNANGQVVPDGTPIPFKTDGSGSVKVAFKLPANIQRGEGSLTVKFDDGANIDSIVRPIPILLKDVQVEFFPEGGDLVSGVPNRVYFQARTMLDKPAELRGKIVDGAGKVVADAATLHDDEQPGVNQGTGRFEFTPVAGTKYQLKIESPAGIDKPFALPAIKDGGVTLRIPAGVTTEKDSIKVVVTSADKNRTLLVGAYCRGRLLDHQRVEAAKGAAREVVLAPAGGMGGVYRVTVFEEGPMAGKHPQLTPMAERLVYRVPAERLNLTIKPDKQRYVPGDKATISLVATNERGERVPAVVLVAVTDLSVLTMADEKTARTMPTHFYLTTEVRRPEDLEYADFLLSDHPKAIPALDLLLGTQGWRRFAEQKKPEQFQKEQKDDADRLLVLSGQLTPEDKRQQMTSTAQLEKEQVRARYQEKFDKVNVDYIDAELALTNTEEAKARFESAALPILQKEITQAKSDYKLAQERLHQREDNLHKLRSLAILVLGMVLVFATVIAVALGVLRGLPGAVPYFATATACTVLVLGLVTLLALQQGPGGESSFTFQAPAKKAPDSTVTQGTGSAMDAEEKAAEAKPDAAEAGQGGGAGDMRKERGKLDKALIAPRAPQPLADFDVVKGKKPGAGFNPRPLALPAMAGRPHNGGPRFGAPQAKGEGKGWGRGLPNANRAAGEQLAGRRQALQLKKRLRDLPKDGKDMLEKQADRKRALARDDEAIQDEQAHAVEQFQAPLMVREYAHQRQPNTTGVRKDFAETLCWQPVIVLPEDGQTQVSFDLCDSVTRFQVAACAHTLNGRLGANTQTFESRLPFSIEPKLPLEVTAGDRFAVPVTISNDTSDRRWVTVRVHAEGLKLATGTGEERLEIAANDRARRLFWFQATLTEGGTATLRIDGKSEPFAADSVQHTIKVVPQGFPVVEARSDVLETNARHDIVLPGGHIKGSLKCQVQVYPSTLADLQQGLEALLREPCGCFEQTSTSNYPNVLILNYLKESGKPKPEVEKDALGKLDRGYHMLTSFECLDQPSSSRRGYEWFGGTAPAHEALTAYGLMEFRDMAKVYKVDDAMIQRTRTYLMAQKDGKGGFKRNARALDTFGRAPEDITNAYIVWALTESSQEDDVATELEALTKQAEKSDDPYLVALVANSLYNRGKNEEGLALLKKLAAAQKEDGHLDATRTSITGSGGRDLQIETTGLTVLAWLKGKRPDLFNPNLRKSMTWIGKQRGGYGGFGSTQSTILALKALIAYAKENRKTSEPGELSLFVGDKLVAGPLAFKAGHEGALTLEVRDPDQLVRDNKLAVRIGITAKDAYPYTLTWSYRAEKQASAAQCAVQVSTRLGQTTVQEGNSVRLTAIVENKQDKGQSMAVAIIGLPAGLTLPEDMKQLKDYARLRKDGTEPGLISAWEIKGRELVLYWRGLAPKQKIEVNLDLIARVPGEYSGPASRAYLYYNADHKCWVDPLKVEVQAKAGQ